MVRGGSNWWAVLGLIALIGLPLTTWWVHNTENYGPYGRIAEYMYYEKDYFGNDDDKKSVGESVRVAIGIWFMTIVVLGLILGFVFAVFWCSIESWMTLKNSSKGVWGKVKTSKVAERIKSKEEKEQPHNEGNM